MDYEEKKRRELIRAIIAEVGMAIAVVAIVVVSILAAMGFFISGKGKIEQSGLLQLRTLPTGATVELDGSVLFSRTNISRTMPSGDHTLKLSRDGYDIWEKTITMKPGELMPLYYPRLFLQNRTAEEVLDLSAGPKDPAAEKKSPSVYSVSSYRNYILYAREHESTWYLLDIKRENNLRPVAIELGEVLPGMIDEKTQGQDSKTRTQVSKTQTQDSKTREQDSKTYRFDGEVLDIKWSSNEEKVLVLVEYENKKSWVLINLRDPAKSLNLTEAFNLDYEKLAIIDSGAEQLYALENHQIRKINIGSGLISRALVTNVTEFANHGSDIIYVKKTDKGQTVGTLRDGEDGPVEITSFPASDKVHVAIARYYDEDYLCITNDKNLTIYVGQVPNYKSEIQELGLKILIDGSKLQNLPSKLLTSPDGGYLVGVSEGYSFFAVTDLYTGKIYEYNAGGSDLSWFDSSMMYAIYDGGHIYVWDFDGTNRRDLTASSKTIDGTISQAEYAPIVLSSNNRYLYYLSGLKKNVLLREKIRD